MSRKQISRLKLKYNLGFYLNSWNSYQKGVTKFTYHNITKRVTNLRRIQCLYRLKTCTTKRPQRNMRTVIN